MNQQTICTLDDIIPETGVCALIDGKQIAIFRTKENDLFALDKRSIQSSQCTVTGVDWWNHDYR